MKGFGAAVKAGPEAVAEVARGDMAKMPLTKADAATARELPGRPTSPSSRRSRCRSEGTRSRGRPVKMPLFYRSVGREAGEGLEPVDLHARRGRSAQGRQRSAMGKPEEL